MEEKKTFKIDSLIEQLEEIKALKEENVTLIRVNRAYKEMLVRFALQNGGNTFGIPRIENSDIYDWDRVDIMNGDGATL